MENGQLHIRRYTLQDWETVLHLHEAGLREMGTFTKEPGFAQEILDTLQSRASELGYTKLYLDTGINQEAARKLYEANDYRKTGRGTVGPLERVFYEKHLV